MSLIEPNSRIDFLRGVPFDPSYENTMYFDNINQQVSYFDTKIAVPFERFSYVRVDNGYIKVGWSIDGGNATAIKDLYNANYMRFKNTSFENKWFYAFVDRVEYINNNTVGVYYHLDVMQTWHFEYAFNQCFIERQHTETDRLGANTIPENFELGDYITDGFSYFDYEPCAVVVTAGDRSGTYQGGTVRQGKMRRGNWFTGVSFTAYNISNQTELDALNNLLERAYTNRETLNTIIAIFMMPRWFFDNPTSVQSTVQSVITPGVSGYHLGQYPVRNAKLMTYPYNMLYVSNNQGNHLELHFEYFGDPTACKLEVWGNMSTSPGIMIYPIDYKIYDPYHNDNPNFDEILTISGFPMCAWANDAYKAWIAQNAGSLNTAIFGAAVSWGDTLIKGKNYADDIQNRVAIGNHPFIKNSASAYGSAKAQENRSLSDLSTSASRSLIATAAIIGQMRDHAVQPPSAHGATNGNLIYQAGLMTFMYCHKHIRPEYAAIIDDFFDMYGYAVHRSGIPNRNARPCYTFVKTADCSLDGNVPVAYLREIEEIFNKGVRFWRTTASFGVYDVAVNNNAPVI